MKARECSFIAAFLQRFRPILLATSITVPGLLPSYPGGGEVRDHMAVMIAAGLLFGTIFTMFFNGIL